MINKIKTSMNLKEKFILIFFIVCISFILFFASLAISTIVIQASKTDNLVCTIYTDNVDYEHIEYSMIDRNIFNTRIFFKDSKFNEITIVDNYVQECTPK